MACGSRWTRDGDRMHDEQVNVLTVVANESYERYVERLQSEIEDEYGAEGLPPKPANARKRKTAELRKSTRSSPSSKSCGSASSTRRATR